MSAKHTKTHHGDTTPLIISAGNQDTPEVVTSRTAGRFKKMFPRLRPQAASVEDLTALGERMTTNSADSNNGAIPAGFTYFGQFVDHDLTFDQTMLTNNIKKPSFGFQLRSPELDLDSLYGAGPDVLHFMFNGDKFRLGSNTASDNNIVNDASLLHDLPRLNQTAVIADPRNDENLIVAQLHLAFMNFHNRVLDFVNANPAVAKPNETRFETARRLVTWHYQWVVLNDFVRRLVDDVVFQDVRTNGNQFYVVKLGARPYMPVEFSVAAYRLGHSMVRSEYDYNTVFTPFAGVRTLAPATLDFLFGFTGGGGIQPDPTSPSPSSLSNVPSNWIIDWHRFLEIKGNKPSNMANPIDTTLADPLKRLHSFPSTQSHNNLAVRNLIRGKMRGLPSGQSIAIEMGEIPLQINVVSDINPEFQENTPLWYYILHEAEVVGTGKLGKVGSRIIAEVFFGIVKADHNSFMSSHDWKPVLPVDSSGKVTGNFTLADLVGFAYGFDDQKLNPVG